MGRSDAYSDKVVVVDRVGRRFSVWTQDGEHIGNLAYGGSVPREVDGHDTTLVYRQEIKDPSDRRQERISGLSLATGTAHVFATLPRTGILTTSYTDKVPARLIRSYNQGRADATDRGRPTFAVGLGGRVYVTSTAEYEVRVFQPDGESLRTLRREVDLLPFPEEEIERYVRQRSRDWGISRSDINYPEHLPAIRSLRTDGRGNLFVFPFVYRRRDEAPPESWPVDIFSQDGELMFSATINLLGWEAAHGDSVYVFEDDPVSGNRVVARYRISLR